MNDDNLSAVKNRAGIPKAEKRRMPSGHRQFSLLPKVSGARSHLPRPNGLQVLRRHASFGMMQLDPARPMRRPRREQSVQGSHNFTGEALDAGEPLSEEPPVDHQARASVVRGADEFRFRPSRDKLAAAYAAEDHHRTDPRVGE